MNSHACLRSLFFATVFLLGSNLLTAQTAISGSIYNGSGGPLAGLYVATGTLTVPAGQTLTVAAGTIIKFQYGLEFDVNGTLTVNGTSGSPVIFTSYQDDSAGGDTNGNGPSNGNAADWRGLVFTGAGSSASSLAYAEVRYGGSAYYADVELSNASPAFNHCTMRNGFWTGMNLAGNSLPTVSNSTITSNGGIAITGVPIAAVPNMTGNVATGNAGNYLLVTAGTVTSNLSITSSSMVTGAIVLNTNLSINAGAALTLGAGVVCKFANNGLEVDINGTLVANGTSGSPVIFTSFADDSAGGDTNSDGPSSGGIAEWRGLMFGSTSVASSLTYAEVRYGGASSYADVEISGANPSFSHCTFRNGYANGMNLSGTSLPTVSNCAFTNNGYVAITGVPISALPGITNNTATGNGGNYVLVTTASVAANLAISSSSMMTGAIVFNTNVTINAGVTLTLNAGVVFKFHNNLEVDVYGTMTCNGASGNPVIFTAYSDDSAGGDTNNDGASNGTAGYWRGVVFSGSGSNASALTYAEVRFGGSSYYACAEMSGANPAFDHCAFRNGYAAGMNLAGNSLPTVSNCTFTGNGAVAITGVPIAGVPHFSANTATGNVGNYLLVTTATVASNLLINSSSMVTGAIMFNTSLTINAGATLTLGAGVACKFLGGSLSVDVSGTLVANGTMASPVIFTSSGDDSAGGDTNSDGPSTGNGADWRGLAFGPTSGASSLTYAEVRYGGGYLVANAEVASNATFSHCTFRNGYAHAMNLTSAARPSVSNCAFTNNGGTAVNNADIAAVPGFVNNTASGNMANYINVTGATVSTNLAIGAQSVIGGALVISTNVNVQPSGTLTLNQGVVVKLNGNNLVTVDGALNLRGTSYEPVVLTALSDDSWGGDTGNNGPTTGSPAWWYGIVVNSGAGTSIFENAIIRYPGSAYYAGVTSTSPNLRLRAVRVDSGYANGFTLSAVSGNPANLIAFGCGGYGIQMTGGSFNVVHATCASNNVGIRAEAAWTGNVVNSIAWSNTTNFGNVPVGQVDHSDGLVASGTNLNVDPQFVSLANGDLHVLSGSPCINTAELLTSFAVQKDFDENSRILDAHLTGAVASDMGAYEYAAWDVVVNGVPKLGSNVFFTVQGPPGVSLYGMGILDGVDPIAPYGFILIGATPYVSVVQLSPTTIPVGTSFFVGMPGDLSLAGLSGGIQTLTTPTGNSSVGNFTRMWRATLRP
jgi:hypothetical protein